jgi:hypothetical protein
MEGSTSFNIVVHKKSIGHQYTASIDCEDLRENHSTPRAKRISAAAGVVDQMDLLELIFTRLSLPAFRLLKAVMSKKAIFRLSAENIAESLLAVKGKWNQFACFQAAYLLEVYAHSPCQ